MMHTPFEPPYVAEQEPREVLVDIHTEYDLTGCGHVVYVGVANTNLWFASRERNVPIDVQPGSRPDEDASRGCVMRLNPSQRHNPSADLWQQRLLDGLTGALRVRGLRLCQYSLNILCETLWPGLPWHRIHTKEMA